jgi:hypothetical protein
MEVVVRMGDSARLSGVVIHGDNALPVPNADVSLIDVPMGLNIPGAIISGPPYRRVARVRADGQGGFSIGPLPPGSYRVQAAKDDLASEEYPVEVLMSDTPAIEIPLQLVPLVRGSLLGLDGAPVESALVFFAKGDGPPSSEPLPAPGGTFEKRLSSSGEWRIIASDEISGETASVTVNLQPGEERDVVINLSQRVKLNGRVFINNQPATEINLILRSDNGDDAVALPSGSGAGHYEANVFPGTVRVIWSSDLFSIEAGSPFAVSDEPAIQTRDIDLALVDIDLILDSGDRNVDSGLLDISLVRTGTKVPILRGYRMDRPTMRLFRMPEGQYEATLTRDGQQVATSGVVDVAQGLDNVLILFEVTGGVAGP